jgi:hypothetical protein
MPEAVLGWSEVRLETEHIRGPHRLLKCIVSDSASPNHLRSDSAPLLTGGTTPRTCRGVILMSSKILVIIATSDKEKTLTALMYAGNALRYD